MSLKLLLSSGNSTTVRNHEIIRSSSVRLMSFASSLEENATLLSCTNKYKG